MTCLNGISNANTACPVSPFFSCWIMGASIRQRCVIVWVRHANSFLFVCLCQSARHTAVHRIGNSPNPNSKVLIFFNQLMFASLGNCLSFHGRFLFIDFFVALFVYLSSAHYHIIAMIALWNKSCRRLLSNQSTYCTMRHVSDTYWQHFDGLLIQ